MVDCDDGIEKAAIGWAQPSPEDCLMEKEAQAEYAAVSYTPLDVYKRQLYERLSRDDELQGESNSISNQKKMLEDYAPVSYTHLDVYKRQE